MALKSLEEEDEMEENSEKWIEMTRKARILEGDRSPASLVMGEGLNGIGCVGLKEDLKNKMCFVMSRLITEDDESIRIKYPSP